MKISQTIYFMLQILFFSNRKQKHHTNIYSD
nr:MAG TPA: hypothetical protein [Caudoviricetes sp.]